MILKVCIEAEDGRGVLVGLRCTDSTAPRESMVEVRAAVDRSGASNRSAGGSIGGWCCWRGDLPASCAREHKAGVVVRGACEMVVCPKAGQQPEVSKEKHTKHLQANKVSSIYRKLVLQWCKRVGFICLCVYRGRGGGSR